MFKKKIGWLEKRTERKLTIITEDEYKLLREPRYKEMSEKDLCLRTSDYIYCVQLFKRV